MRAASNHGRECPFCGHPERPEFLKIWATHEFMLETCCADFHDNVVQEMAFDPGWARAILRQLGAEVLTGHRLRRLADDGACGMILEWQLATNPISHAVARAFVTTHHAYCGAPVTWRFGQSVWNWQTLLGVVMVGNPAARAFNGRHVLEVNRLCLRRDIPRALAWNAASMLYGWSAREAERRGWQRIITYTRADEDGTSLKAAGWTKEAEVRGRG